MLKQEVLKERRQSQKGAKTFCGGSRLTIRCSGILRENLQILVKFQNLSLLSKSAELGHYPKSSHHISKLSITESGVAYRMLDLPMP
jgi:hypothetical protein